MDELWTEARQTRLDLLRAKDDDGSLSEAERAELTFLAARPT